MVKPVHLGLNPRLSTVVYSYLEERISLRKEHTVAEAEEDANAILVGSRRAPASHTCFPICSELKLGGL
jgi:hypothetical protein